MVQKFKLLALSILISQAACQPVQPESDTASAKKNGTLDKKNYKSHLTVTFEPDEASGGAANKDSTKDPGEKSALPMGTKVKIIVNGEYKDVLCGDVLVARKILKESTLEGCSYKKDNRKIDGRCYDRSDCPPKSTTIVHVSAFNGTLSGGGTMASESSANSANGAIPSTAETGSLKTGFTLAVSVQLLGGENGLFGKTSREDPCTPIDDQMTGFTDSLRDVKEGISQSCHSQSTANTSSSSSSSQPAANPAPASDEAQPAK